MIDAIIFDFYGTLGFASTLGRYEDVLAGLPERTASGLLLDIEEIVEFPLNFSSSVDFTSANEYFGWIRTRGIERIRKFHLPQQSAEVIEGLVDDLMLCNMPDPNTYILYDGVKSLLSQLKASDIKMAVCSNWYWDLPEALTELGIAKYFDVIVASARVGASKPHPRIYGHVLDALERTATSCMFIGDSYEYDVAGPRAQGMSALQISPGGQDIDTLGPRILRMLSDRTAE